MKEGTRKATENGVAYRVACRIRNSDTNGVIKKKKKKKNRYECIQRHAGKIPSEKSVDSPLFFFFCMAFFMQQRGTTT